KVRVDFALQYTHSMETIERSYANFIQTTHGGTHVSGMWSALVTIINEYAVSVGETPFSKQEIASGLTLVISIKHDHASFESMSKIKFINPEAFGVVAGIVYKKLEAIFDTDHEYTKELREIILNKCRANREALRRGG